MGIAAAEMVNSSMTEEVRSILALHAASFYQKGWMWGTAGNLSARSPEGGFWITASGCAKGELTPAQFVRIAVSGELLECATPTAKPSAETSIHQAIYGLFPETQACYHVHSVWATLVSRLAINGYLQLPAIEMIKGLGIWDQNPQVSLAVFPNHGMVPHIAQEIGDRFQQVPPQVSACLIQDHGVTVWGRSPEETRNRVEVIEFLFQYLWHAQLLPPQT